MNKLEIKERIHTVYWSSTECSSTNAWYQTFIGGYQCDISGKTNSFWARAVRRVKKWTNLPLKNVIITGIGQVPKPTIRTHVVSISLLVPWTTLLRRMLSGRGRYGEWRNEQTRNRGKIAYCTLVEYWAQFYERVDSGLRQWQPERQHQDLQWLDESSEASKENRLQRTITAIYNSNIHIANVGQCNERSSRWKHRCFLY